MFMKILTLIRIMIIFNLVFLYSCSVDKINFDPKTSVIKYVGEKILKQERKNNVETVE